MKLSIENYALRQKFSEQDTIKMIKAAGFDCVDYSYYWLTDERILGEEYLEYAEEVKCMLKESGLECNQAHAPFVVRYGEAFDLSNPHFVQTARSIEAAAVLGAESIVVHAVTTPKENRTTELTDYNVRYYKSLEPYAKKCGIKIAVENLFAYDPETRRRDGILATPKELNTILDKLDSPWFTACIDIGHASVTGIEPQDFIRGMNNQRLTVLHVQDTDYLADRHYLPFMGELNWEEIMSSLKEIGYKGELTFEVFNFLKKLPDTILPDALKYSASVGRKLIDMFNNMKGVSL